MSGTAMRWYNQARPMIERRSDRLVLRELALNAPRDSARVVMSTARIAAGAKITRLSAFRSLRSLEKSGHIFPASHLAGPGRVVNAWELNLAGRPGGAAGPRPGRTEDDVFVLRAAEVKIWADLNRAPADGLVVLRPVARIESGTHAGAALVSFDSLINPSPGGASTPAPVGAMSGGGPGRGTRDRQEDGEWREMVIEGLV
jgi:hypothetical protein